MYIYKSVIKIGKQIIKEEKVFLTSKTAISYFKNAVMHYFIDNKQFLNEYNYREYIDDLVETSDAQYDVYGERAYFKNYGSVIEVSPLKYPELYILNGNDHIFVEALTEGATAFRKTKDGYRAYEVVAIRERMIWEDKTLDPELFNTWIQEKKSQIAKAFPDNKEAQMREIEKLPEGYSFHLWALKHFYKENGKFSHSEIIDVFLSEESEETSFKDDFPLPIAKIHLN